MSDQTEQVSVSYQQAQETIDLVRQMQEHTRKAMASGQASSLLMLWGAVWFFSFLGCYFLAVQDYWVWMAGNLVGLTGTVLLFIRGKERIRTRNSDSKRFFWTLFWFWFLLFLYGDVFLMLLWTDSGFTNLQIAAFLCALIMFAYVVMGLIIDAHFLVWLGLAVTVLILVGYLFARDYFNLWMAPAGGGTLFFTGLYIRLKWR